MDAKEFKFGDLVSYVVGMPGPDTDDGIYLRREGDEHVIWAGTWGKPPWKERRLKAGSDRAWDRLWVVMSASPFPGVAEERARIIAAGSPPRRPFELERDDGRTKPNA